MMLNQQCCNWNMAKIDPLDGSVVWKKWVIGQNPDGDASDVVCEIEALFGTDDMLAMVVNGDPGGFDDPTFTLCRINGSTGSVVWSYPAGYGAATNQRTFASDGVNIFVRTTSDLQALDYSGAPVWNNTLPFTSTLMQVFSVYTQPGQTSVVIYQDWDGITSGNYVSCYDGPSGSLISNFTPPAGSKNIISQDANYGDFRMQGAAYLEYRNGANNPGTPYALPASSSPLAITGLISRSRINATNGLWFTKTSPSAIGSDFGVPTTFHEFTSIPGSTSLTFTPFDIDTPHTFVYGQIIGSNNQTQPGMEDPFNVFGLNNGYPVSAFSIGWGVQVGKDSPTGFDPQCFAVAMDHKLRGGYGNFLYVGGPLGTG